MFTLRTERNEYGLPKHLSPHKPSEHGGYCKSYKLHTSLAYFINKKTRAGAAFTQAAQFLQSGFACAYLHSNALPYVQMCLCYIQMPSLMFVCTYATSKCPPLYSNVPKLHPNAPPLCSYIPISIQMLLPYVRVYLCYIQLPLSYVCMYL